MSHITPLRDLAQYGLEACGEKKDVSLNCEKFRNRSGWLESLVGEH